MTLILIASAIAIAITVPIFLRLHASRAPGALTFAASATVASAHVAWRASGNSAAQDLLDVVIPLLMLLGCLLMLSGFRQLVSKPALRPLTLVAILVPIAGLLTGALSRRAFLEIAAPHFDHNRAVLNDAALLFLDLDHFKQINDRYGHDTGDRALRHFVEVASKVLPSQARLGRLGGEEFAILLPASTAAVASSVSEKVLNALRNAPLSGAKQSIPLTVSIGVATARPDDSTDEALKRADAALYQAKANGRDRFCIADEVSDDAANRNEKLQDRDRGEQRTWIEATPPLVPAT